EARSRLADVRAPGVESSLADVRAQLAALVYPGFVTATGADRLPDVARYLRAISRRLETLPRSPARDREWRAQVHQAARAYGERGGPAEVRWMLEELRVSFWAQSLGTRYPISPQRIERALDDHADRG